MNHLAAAAAENDHLDVLLSRLDLVCFESMRNLQLNRHGRDPIHQHHGLQKE